MDFFNKLSKKASEAYQVTKDKASDISQEIKIKGKIGDCEDKIEALYKAIGELVYNEVKEYRDVSQEQVQDKVNEIKTNFEEIERLKADLLSLKKIKKCVGCGSELDINAEFCSKCGTKQPEPVVEESAPEVTEEQAPETTESTDENKE